MSTMFMVARGIQFVGLCMTGYAALSAFWIDFSEAALFQWGLGGLAVFWVGTGLLRKAS